MEVRIERSFHSGWAFAGLSGVVFVAQAGMTAMNPALPSVEQSMSVSTVAAQYVVTAYLAAITSTIVVAGILGDYLGRRRLLSIGCVLTVLASLAGSVAPQFGWLIGARIAQGVGAAMLTAMAMAIAIDIAPAFRTGSALGTLNATSSFATTLGPSLGGVAVAVFGWRGILALNVPVAFAVWFLVRNCVPSTRAAAAGALPNLGVARNPRIACGIVSSILVSCVMISTLVNGAFIFAQTYGLNALATGFAVAFGPLLTALVSVPAGRIADRFGRRRTSMSALALMTCGTIGVALASRSAPLAVYLTAMAGVNAGYALFQTPLSALVMAEAKAHERGAVSGVLNFARSLGLTAGAVVLGALFTRAGATAAFLSAAVCAVTALAVVAAMPGRQDISARLVR